MPISIRLVAAGLVGVVLAAGAIAPSAAAPQQVTQVQAPPSVTVAADQADQADQTPPLEAHRVDRVAAPVLDWYPCFGDAECATARVPLDYDKPTGATTELALLRMKARDQKHRIGSLFVNPGGPGGQATALAYAAPYFLSEGILDRFDIVGVDPRGVGFSDNLQCFRSAKEQSVVLAPLTVAFPYTKKEEKAYVTASKVEGKACSTTGKTLAGAMSTAEVARDMDVMRRSVGDAKLTYLGFSYGSVLGQYYANLFPDRVRSVVVDGVIDPRKWVGDAKTKETPTFDRIRSADGAAKALKEILVRCDKVGGQQCTFAAGDPVKNFETIAKRLRAKPLVIEESGFDPITVTYADFVILVLISLYAPDGYSSVIDIATQLYTLTEPPAATTAAARATAREAIATRFGTTATGRPTAGFPYDNSLDAFASISCTDTLNPKDAESFPARGAAADQRAPYFGRPWAWNTSWCASNTWTVQDEDAYRGPFNRNTVKPVLVVGNYWDPATNYNGATAAAKLLPNSRLLSSTNWGHTAYGTSQCATSAIDAYLLKGTLPAKGKVCQGDIQPFATPSETARAAVARTTRPSTDIDKLVKQGRPAPGTDKQLPPITPPLPASLLTGAR